LHATGNSGVSLRDIANTHVQLGDVLVRQGRHADALTEYQDGVRICEKLVAEDPGNVQGKRDLHIALGRIADVTLAMGRRAEARVFTLRALRVLRPMVASPNASVYDLQQFAWLLLTTPFPDLTDEDAALEAAERAVTLTNRTDPALLDTLARAHYVKGHSDRALAVEEEALRLVPAGKSALRNELESNLARFRGANGRSRAVAPDRQ
jgi:tetratricopeptide (TPR) repeat protein